MAEEFTGKGWWDAQRSSYEQGNASYSYSTSSSRLTSLRGVGRRSSRESVSISGGGGPLMFLNAEKMQVKGRGSSVLGDSGGGITMDDPNLHIMNWGLSSQPMDWDNNNLIQGDKSETGFCAMLQENLNMNATPDGPSSHHPIQSGFQIDYRASPPSSLFQGILGSENQSSTISYQYAPSYRHNSGELLQAWSKIPQVLRVSPPKHQQQSAASSHNQLHFSNNAPFWNATAASSTQSSQFSTSSFEEKAKSFPDHVPSVAAAPGKKIGSESPAKRSRVGETGTPLPPFKMGDRITALQQLVSPFGKTGTAFVLTEAIDHIKFLHEQVSVLSAPYMKSGGVLQQHQDLRSRGLCLVPVSSTFPVTYETAVDYWNHTLGGTYR